jgi:hypothetical protein
MLDKYVLDAVGKPVLEPDLLKWARWLEGADQQRQLARTDLPGGGRVSTVFLGVDHKTRERDEARELARLWLEGLATGAGNASCSLISPLHWPIDSICGRDLLAAGLRVVRSWPGSVQ